MDTVSIVSEMIGPAIDAAVTCKSIDAEKAEKEAALKLRSGTREPRLAPTEADGGYRKSQRFVSDDRTLRAFRGLIAR